MSNENCILCMIVNIDRKTSSMKLYDHLTGKECLYKAESQEISRYEEVFDTALDNNIYSFVEYDTAKQVIIAI